MVIDNKFVMFCVHKSFSLKDANMYYQIDRNRLNCIKLYVQTAAEIAAPAEPIVTVPMWLVPMTYHAMTHTGRVAVAKYDEPVKFRWIEGTRSREVEPERVKVLVR